MRKEKGITLIALVVTIVVLLILAGVSISMLTGENGIITQAQNSKEATEQARVEELVDLAVNSLIGENQGSTNGITPEMVAEEVNEMENREDIYAEGSTFPTNIIFPEEDRKVEVNLEQKEDLSEMYEVAVDEKDIAPMDLFEKDIAPMDLFDYEITDEAETGALKLSSLPTKKVRITQIKEEYCNGFKYGGHENKDTNYEIMYKDEKISDTLVIPYKVDGKYVTGGIEGEMYLITEVQLFSSGQDGHGFGYSFPRVETVIYPNTVEEIYGKTCGDRYYNETLKTVILPNKLKIIGENAFSGCYKLNNMTVPDSVVEVGGSAIPDNFIDNLPDGEIYIGKCLYEYKGEMPSGTKLEIKEGTTQIGYMAFGNCTNLVSIIIPDM